MSFYSSIIRPLMFRLPAETAHDLGIRALRLGRFVREEDGAPFGPLERFGLTFKNPIGMAAGFDKNALVVDQLCSLGFGFVEVGTVTFKAQAGNPKPRLFRLPADRALINRLGFNNDGAAAIAERLKSLERRCIVGVNIGKNKDVPIAAASEDYLRVLNVVHRVADYIAVNVSSPNTANLRDLQVRARLEELLSALVKRNTELGAKPLLLKIAPDLSEQEIESIVGICTDLRLSGMIATNTTVSRSGLNTQDIKSFGEGGISGAPLTHRSRDVIAAIRRHSKGKLPIIGVGGIMTPEAAFAKIAAGACLLQTYTGFVYGGPSFARELNKGLLTIIRKRGFTSLDEAVGSSENGR
ncbi:MAG TPA: quinone-dependent dihydroorotate dehydrogenase [Pyrinomonadaceae bacterium]|nr:quinone-dependent dihydroorotate dehydrogenase [Pyrinomonadaceae bacterium]